MLDEESRGCVVGDSVVLRGEAGAHHSQRADEPGSDESAHFEADERQALDAALAHDDDAPPLRAAARHHHPHGSRATRRRLNAPRRDGPHAPSSGG